MKNPYLIPDDGFHHVINFSGGRTSAYMLSMIVEAHSGTLPANVHCLFCNTGKELDETLNFVQRVGSHLGVPIVWLEYDYDKSAGGGIKDPKRTYHIVNHNSASRNGEPFATLIRESRMVPNVKLRKCTAELKVETIRRYMLREHGVMRKFFRNIVGLRFDEPRRWEKKIFEDCRLLFPLVPARVVEEDVLKYWQAMPFDLGLQSSQGNCDLCFLKGKGKLKRLIRHNPGLADWWIGMEEESAGFKQPCGPLRKPETAHFSKRHTYLELREQALREQSFPDFDDDEQECFCTD